MVISEFNHWVQHQWERDGSLINDLPAAHFSWQWVLFRSTRPFPSPNQPEPYLLAPSPASNKDIVGIGLFANQVTEHAYFTSNTMDATVVGDTLPNVHVDWRVVRLRRGDVYGASVPYLANQDDWDLSVRTRGPAQSTIPAAFRRSTSNTATRLSSTTTATFEWLLCHKNDVYPTSSLASVLDPPATTPTKGGRYSGLFRRHFRNLFGGGHGGYRVSQGLPRLPL